MKNKVFVYGTLKRGFGNYERILENSSTFLGEYTSKEKYSMLNFGPFPGVLLNGKGKIKGEVFEVDNNTFKRLDELEGYPHFYNRLEIDTIYGKAWMYYVSRDDEYTRDRDLVADGDWKGNENWKRGVI